MFHKKLKTVRPSFKFSFKEKIYCIFLPKTKNKTHSNMAL